MPELFRHDHAPSDQTGLTCPVSRMVSVFLLVTR